MIRKILLLMSVVVLSISTFMPSAFAEQIHVSFDWEEVNKLHQQMIEHYESGTEDEIQELELYKKYITLFTENEGVYNYYADNTLANDEEAIRDAINSISPESNERIVHEFEDGSFLVIDAEHYTYSTNSGEQPGIMSDMVHYTDNVIELNQNGVYAFTYKTGGIVTLHIKLTTEYKVTGRTNIEVTDVSVVGTKTSWPRSIDGSASIIKNNDSAIKTKGTYTISGVPPFGSFTGELTQNISIDTYISDTNIRLAMSTYWAE